MAHDAATCDCMGAVRGLMRDAIAAGKPRGAAFRDSWTQHKQQHAARDKRALFFGGMRDAIRRGVPARDALAAWHRDEWPQRGPSPAAMGAAAAKKDDAERDALKSAGRKVPSSLTGVKDSHRATIDAWMKKRRAA